MNVEKFYNKVQDVIEGKTDYVILQGHALESLKQLPSDLVQCVVTSPPYFGLRSYGTDPQLWGGDPNCEHTWVETAPRRLRTEKDVKNPNTIQNANKGANCALKPTRACTICDTWEGELGHEPTPEQFVKNLVSIFKEVKRVLRPDGVCLVNLADTYWAGKTKASKHATIKPLDLCMVPQRFAIAMQEDGWYVRSEIIWDKRNMCMPESVNTRCTRAHEQIWQFTKSPDYFWDDFAIRDYVDGGDPFGANKRDVWTLKPTKFDGEHYAGYPIQLPEFGIKVGSSQKGRCSICNAPYERLVERVSKERYELDPQDERYRPARYESKYDALKGSEGTGMRYSQLTEKGWQPTCKCKGVILPSIVMDIFNGSGTTGLAAVQNGRSYIGLELNPEYVTMSKERIDGTKLPLLELFNE